MLRRAQVELENARGELADFMIRETGCIRIKAMQEITKAASELENASALADVPYGELLPHEDPSVLSMARRVPVGVVGVITPWNAPLMLAMRSVAPALVLGNAVLLKPDLKTAVSGGVALARIFEAAGLPEGCWPSCRETVRWARPWYVRRTPRRSRSRGHPQSVIGWGRSPAAC